MLTTLDGTEAILDNRVAPRVAEDGENLVFGKPVKANKGVQDVLRPEIYVE